MRLSLHVLAKSLLHQQHHFRDIFKRPIMGIVTWRLESSKIKYFQILLLKICSVWLGLRASKSLVSRREAADPAASSV
jgi:hypothetical protein